MPRHESTAPPAYLGAARESAALYSVRCAHMGDALSLGYATHERDPCPGSGLPVWSSPHRPPETIFTTPVMAPESVSNKINLENHTAYAGFQDQRLREKASDHGNPVVYARARVPLPLQTSGSRAWEPTTKKVRGRVLRVWRRVLSYPHNKKERAGHEVRNARTRVTTPKPRS